MGSRQAIEEENAEAAARVAVDKLSEVNKERRTHREAAGTNWPQTETGNPQQEKGPPGVLGNIMKSMGDTYEHFKESITTKTSYGDDKSSSTTAAAGENKDYGGGIMGMAGEAKVVDSAVEKARQGGGGKYYREYGIGDDQKGRESTTQDLAAMGTKLAGYASEKTGEYKDLATDKMKEAADMAAQKAAEVTDYTTEKAKEEKEAVSGRMAELKEKAAAAARKARGYFTGNPEHLDKKALQGGDITDEKYGESEFKARQKMEELKLEEEGLYDEAKQRAEASWETAADRGIAAKRNIYGGPWVPGISLKEAMKDKLTFPTDVVQQARASREYGGPKRGEKMVEDIEGPSGPGSMPTVKTSD